MSTIIIMLLLSMILTLVALIVIEMILGKDKK